MKRPGYWDYRVMRRKHEDGSVAFGVYEVYFDGKDRVEGWTESPIGHEHDNLTDMKDDLRWQAEAIEREVLEYK